MDYELTISDPTTWSRPWTALIRLKSTDESNDRVRLPRRESSRRARHPWWRTRRGRSRAGLHCALRPCSGHPERVEGPVWINAASRADATTETHNPPTREASSDGGADMHVSQDDARYQVNVQRNTEHQWDKRGEQ